MFFSRCGIGRVLLISVKLVLAVGGEEERGDKSSGWVDHGGGGQEGVGNGWGDHEGNKGCHREGKVMFF